MIYLVGGPVRVGKSTLAKLVLQRQCIASISTDALTSPIGHLIPETKLWGCTPQEEWEDRAYPFIRRFLKTIQYDYPDFLLEGAPLSPRIINRLSQKFELKAVIVGNTHITPSNLIQHMGTNIWIKTLNRQDLSHTAQQIIDHSLSLKDQTRHFNYPYIDLSDDFKRQLELAYKALF
jgi:hypothetical protein